MFETTQAFSGFAVDDLDAARAFYGETLGIGVCSVMDGMVLQLELAGGERPTMVYAKPDFAPATYTILNFPVADLEAAIDGLVSRGVTFERYDEMPQDERGITSGPDGAGPRIAWFKDPAGNILAVIEDDGAPS